MELFKYMEQLKICWNIRGMLLKLCNLIKYASKPQVVNYSFDRHFANDGNMLNC